MSSSSSSSLEPKCALMHFFFPLMLAINMNGLWVLLYRNLFLDLFECLWRGALTAGENSAPRDLGTSLYSTLTKILER